MRCVEIAAGSVLAFTNRAKSASKAICALLLAATLIAADVSPAFARQNFAAISIDARNGKILFSDDPDGKRYPASLTKVMTLYILFQDLKAGRIRLNSQMRVSRRAASMPATKLNVKAGSTLLVETAIKSLVVQSANDASVVIAENLGGTEANFAARMTRVARKLGMSRTTYANANGLPNAKQVTTARDQATLALRIMRDFPQYYPYFRTTAFSYKGRTFRSHNRLVGNYAGTDGIKTGYTNAAGYNLTTSTRRGEKRLIGVVMGARSSGRRSAFMMKMMEKSFPHAVDGRTIAALAGSSSGAIDPVAPSRTKSAAKEITTPDAQDALAVASQNAAVDTDAQTASTDAPQVSGGLVASEKVIQSGPAWKIQVGAYPSKDMAMQEIRGLQSANLRVLEGKQAFTVAFEKGEDIIYRARFSGFNKISARNACLEIAKRGMNCLALSPQS
jgi:D-alanyl-D-alanine carboxypeptidase